MARREQETFTVVLLSLAAVGLIVYLISRMTPPAGTTSTAQSVGSAANLQQAAALYALQNQTPAAPVEEIPSTISTTLSDSTAGPSLPGQTSTNDLASTPAVVSGGGGGGGLL